MSEQKPKSIRLNQFHRESILRAVMDQWAKTNPPPSESTPAKLVRGVLERQMEINKASTVDVPAEEKQLLLVFERTERFAEAAKQLPSADLSVISAPQTKRFRVEVRAEDHTPTRMEEFVIPVALAREYGVPFYKTVMMYDNNPQEATTCREWPEYTEQVTLAGDEQPVQRLEVVTVIDSGRVSVCVPDTFTPVRDYQKGQRARRRWDQKWERMRSEVKDYLDQFNTTNQIRDGWPELVPYLPAHVADPGRVIKLPVLERSRLNERLGLGGDDEQG